MTELNNKSVLFEFFIQDRFVAGMMLTGTEVKALREGNVNFKDSYCLLHKGEIWLKNLHIAEYSHGSSNNHDPVRERKLLLHKREIRKIASKLKEKGCTLVPLRIFFSEKNHAKVEIGLAKGKKQHDKRESIKQKEMKREMLRFTGKQR